MDLQVVHNLVNFLLNKAQGAWYPPEDIDDLILDPGQISLYNDYFTEYAKSQRLDDALAPFKTVYNFNTGNTPGGLINTPDDYFDLLDIYTIVTDSSNRTTRRPCPVVEEDERTDRLNSQVNPASLNYPFCNITKNWDIQLYPAQPQTGVITYLKRPVKPFFSYTTVSQRVIVYNPLLSVQLEWADTQILSVVVKGLGLIGINIGEQDIMQWSEMKDQQNIAGNIKL